MAHTTLRALCWCTAAVTWATAHMPEFPPANAVYEVGDTWTTQSLALYVDPATHFEVSLTVQPGDDLRVSVSLPAHTCVDDGDPVHVNISLPAALPRTPCDPAWEPWHGDEGDDPAAAKFEQWGVGYYRRAAACKTRILAGATVAPVVATIHLSRAVPFTVGLGEAEQIENFVLNPGMQLRLARTFRWFGRGAFAVYWLPWFLAAAVCALMVLCGLEVCRHVGWPCHPTSPLQVAGLVAFVSPTAFVLHMASFGYWGGKGYTAAVLVHVLLPVSAASWLVVGPVVRSTLGTGLLYPFTVSLAGLYLLLFSWQTFFVFELVMLLWVPAHYSSRWYRAWRHRRALADRARWARFADRCRGKPITVYWTHARASNVLRRL